MSIAVASITMSDFIMGITVGSCIVFSIMMVLSDEKKRPTLAILNRSITVFAIPLLIIFFYLAIIWLANIITD